MAMNSSAGGNGQSEATPPALPLFFRDVTALDATRHGTLKLDRTRGLGFASVAHALPLGLEELVIASQHFPVVFTGGGDPMPVAILGYRAEENLFIERDGTWLPDTYIPAYVRSYPFILIEPAGSETAYLGFEQGADAIGDKGEPLFDKGQPTAITTDAMRFALAYRDELKRAAAFAAALDAAGLLQVHEARLAFKSGGTARLDGFRVIDPIKFDQLEDGVILDWRKRGWLAPIFAILQSAGRWGRIVNLGETRRSAGGSPL